MPLSDLPQSILFIIFLLLFVLIGVYPTWKKTAALLRNALRKAETQTDSDILQVTSDQASSHTDQHDAAQLNDFEIFILRRLAQDNDKALSRRQINAELHLEPQMLRPALTSLLQRGLIRLSIGFIGGIRYYLTAAGYNYAIDQGFITSVHQLNNSS